MSEKSSSPLARRSFLTQVGTGVTVLGAGAAITIPVATAQSLGGAPWQAARHDQDDWLEKIPGKHRLVFDTTDPGGMSNATLYAGNFYTANQTGYGLQNADLAVVIVARHNSTAFAYNESIWEKYGDTLSNSIDRNKPPSKTNPNLRQLTTLTGRGMNIAVCLMATTRLAGMIATAANSTQADILTELSANLLPNAHLVPAGIVAVGRAQEHGYALVHAV